jgi:hypothetical protein
MPRALMLVWLSICLSGCGQPEPSDMERQVNMIRAHEAALEAMQDADLILTHQELARSHSAQDAAEQQEAADFAANVSAQQAAQRVLRPVMEACLSSKAYALSRKSPAPASAVTDDVLSGCRPAVDAVARTVELAGLPSAGLTRDLIARLRHRVLALVLAARERPSGNQRCSAATNPAGTCPQFAPE